MAVGQHHGRVVLVHRLAAEPADEPRVGAVCVRQLAGERVEVLAADGALGAPHATIAATPTLLLVTDAEADS